MFKGKKTGPAMLEITRNKSWQFYASLTDKFKHDPAKF